MEQTKALEKRLGFNPEGSIIFHVAGTTFENRQKLLEAMRTYCGFDCAPPVRLEAASDKDKKEFGDPHAIEVWAGVYRDSLTGDWEFSHIGYVPRRVCISCNKSYGGKWLKNKECPFCNSKEIVKLNEVLDKVDKDKIQAGISNVIQSTSKENAPLGCVVHVIIN